MAKQESVKYPRTAHLPWSEGVSRDDISLGSVGRFEGKSVVVTEKMDGENTTMYSDRIHARSLSSNDHPSRHWVKSLWAEIRHEIPEGMRIVGENVYAKHSISYEGVPSFFLVFAIFDGPNCLSWEDTEEWCELLGLAHVSVLYRGEWEEAKVKGCYTGKSLCDGEQEGYVVRNAESFPYVAFSENVAKFVRKGHVQPNAYHWMHQSIVPNRRKGLFWSARLMTGDL